MSILISENLKFSLIYRAEVRENVDPLNSGRVKVYIPGLCDPGELTVWARPCFGSGFTKNYGEWKVPPVGAKVFVFFENGDPSLPVYWGSVILYNEVLDKAIIDGSQEKEYVILRTPNGNVIRISDNKNRIFIETKNQRNIDINDNLQKIEIHTNNHNVDINDQENKITITCGGGQVIICHPNGDVTVNAPKNIIFNGGNKTNATGVVTQECICAFTGKPHFSFSSNVKATK